MSTITNYRYDSNNTPSRWDQLDEAVRHAVTSGGVVVSIHFGAGYGEYQVHPDQASALTVLDRHTGPLASGERGIRTCDDYVDLTPEGRGYSESWCRILPTPALEADGDLFFDDPRQWLAPSEVGYYDNSPGVQALCADRRNRARAALGGVTPAVRYYLGGSWFLSADPNAAVPHMIGDRDFHVSIPVLDARFPVWGDDGTGRQTQIS